MNSERLSALRQSFARLFGQTPRLFRAPGRVNLIGEHTDYNDGFVMPVAISRSTVIAASPRDDRQLHMSSLDFREASGGNVRVSSLDDPRPARAWTDYITGVAAMLERRGLRLRGANLLVASDIPAGAGLSSSAALEMASGWALLHTAGQEMDRTELALAGQEAEHAFVGTLCGIMDQYISANGRAGQATCLDCRSLSAEQLQLPEGFDIVICNTGVKHELASSEYNVRRRECQQGVELLRRFLPRIQNLRDVSLPDFERYRDALPEVIQRRCRHVITENQRVLRTREALREGHWNKLSELLAASHQSLRMDYEVSCAELDLMVDLAQRAPGFLAGRMTGGGFGGCTVNLVERQRSEAFVKAVLTGYNRRTGGNCGIQAEAYVVASASGVCALPDPSPQPELVEQIPGEHCQ